MARDCMVGCCCCWPSLCRVPTYRAVPVWRCMFAVRHGDYGFRVTELPGKVKAAQHYVPGMDIVTPPSCTRSMAPYRYHPHSAVRLPSLPTPTSDGTPGPARPPCTGPGAVGARPNCRHLHGHLTPRRQQHHHHQHKHQQRGTGRDGMRPRGKEGAGRRKARGWRYGCRMVAFLVDGAGVLEGGQDHKTLVSVAAGRLVLGVGRVMRVCCLGG